MARDNVQRRTWSNWMPVSIGLGSALFLILAVGGWSTTAQITGAVIGKGKIQISSSRQALQHPIGGVVAGILVENGDKVEAGDVVLRLDATQLLTELKIIEGELYEILSKEARLQAEIDGVLHMDLHPLLEKAQADDPEIRKLVERQKKHLASRLQSLDTNGRLLRQQIIQVNKEIAGVEAELLSKTKRKEVVDKELEEARDLLQQGLTKRSNLRTLEKDQFTTLGEIGKLSAKIAELRGKISELELKLYALAPKNTEEAINELGKLRPLKTKFLEKRIGAMDMLSNLEIRSPVTGTIHDMQVQGLRSVVVAAKPLMYVVPTERPIVVQIQLDASDIDQVHFEQKAAVKFLAFSRRSTPTIFGTVTKISADAFLDDKTRSLYYEAEISLTHDEVAKLGDKHLLPGMPVVAFLTTESRSPLNYVTKPILDYFDRSFRDA